MITSADGTTIAFDQLGSGPPLVLVSGAMCGRRADEAIAVALAGRVHRAQLRPARPGRQRRDRTVRGRARDRGPRRRAGRGRRVGVAVGISSGGALVLLAAAAGLPITTAIALGGAVPERRARVARVGGRLPESDRGAAGRGTSRRGGGAVPAHRRRAGAGHPRDAAVAVLGRGGEDRADPGVRRGRAGRRRRTGRSSRGRSAARPSCSPEEPAQTCSRPRPRRQRPRCRTGPTGAGRADPRRGAHRAGRRRSATFVGVVHS